MTEIEQALAGAWRLFPHTYAVKASRGRWKPYSHLKLITDRITPGLVQGGGRYIVTLPPRHGKSEFISHYVPVWYLDAFPERQVILSSYAAKFAAKWGRKVRNTLEGFEQARAIVRQDSRAGDRFSLVQGGQMITAGVGGSITGEGGHLGIIDDPFKNWQEAQSELRRETVRDWYLSTFRTRFEANCTIVVLMTRWHEGDLAGFLIDESEEDWQVINMPAIAEADDILGRPLGQALCPERYDLDALAQIKAAVGIKVWTSLYQQRPAAAEGELWKRAHWRRFKELPDRFDEKIQSWDMSFKDKGQSKTGKVDYVVGQVWGRVGRNLYLLDQVRGQWGFTKSMGQVIEMTKKHPDARLKLIEDKANGPAVQDSLKGIITGIRMVEPQGGKVARATAAEPILETGYVWLPADELAHPWVPGFIDEAASFPKAKHDDQVDAASQAILWMDKKGNSFLDKITRR
jgi:predicted phage terminase large subunit-like protein